MKQATALRIAAAGSVAAACLILTIGGSAASGPKPLSSFDPQVKALLARMTLDEKIGQMTQPEQSALEDQADIENYYVGSLLSGGDSDPKEGNSLQAWTDLYDRLQKHTANTRLKIPILYGIDAVHGHSNVLGAVIFPHNVGLGCTRNPALIEKIGRITAEEVRATGIQWAFAPCVTVPQDIRWGRTYEGFSEDPALVRQLGEAAVRGLQGTDLANPLAVLACAKHYAATAAQLGARPPTAAASTRATRAWMKPRCAASTCRATLRPIKAGVGTIMPSY